MLGAQTSCFLCYSNDTEEKQSFTLQIFSCLGKLSKLFIYLCFIFKDIIFNLKMLFLLLKLKRGLVVEDFFTAANVCELHSHYKVLHDFP